MVILAKPTHFWRLPCRLTKRTSQSLLKRTYVKGFDLWVLIVLKPFCKTVGCFFIMTGHLPIGWQVTSGQQEETESTNLEAYTIAIPHSSVNSTVQKNYFELPSDHHMDRSDSCIRLAEFLKLEGTVQILNRSAQSDRILQEQLAPKSQLTVTPHPLLLFTSEN